MKAFCLACVAALILFAPTNAQTNDLCAFDLNAMMQLDVEAFDRTPESGWRLIGNTPGCEAAAADLIADYRTNKIEEQRRGLMHHEAQLRAAAGQTGAAIALLESVRTIETLPEAIAYRDAEIAFLHGDRTALLAARERLLNIPAPEGFEESITRFRERYPNLIPPSWPVNIEVVDGFIACFDRPYQEAYSEPCRGGLAP